MGDLVATDVTISVPVDKRDIGHGALQKNVTIADLTFGDGALTYPTGGVPLPAKEKFGFLKVIDAGLIEQASASGYVHKFDRTNHTIRIYNAGTELTGGGSTPAAVTLRMVFVGE